MNDAGTNNVFVVLVLLRPHQQRKHQIFSAERQYLNGATCLHYGKFCWTTQRLQQHLAYIPKRPGYNPCFHALYSQGWEVDYELVHFPKQVVGLARRESLQTLGPPFEQVMTLSRRCQAWQAELDGCRRQLDIASAPEQPLEQGAQIGDALSEVAQQWFQRDFFPRGPSDSERQELVDSWIQVLCIEYGENKMAWDNWLAFVVLARGDHWLPDLVAEFFGW